MPCLINVLFIDCLSIKCIDRVYINEITMLVNDKFDVSDRVSGDHKRNSSLTPNVKPQTHTSHSLPDLSEEALCFGQGLSAQLLQCH